jgi:hypothetical protein
VHDYHRLPGFRLILEFATDRILDKSLSYSISRPQLAQKAALMLIRHHQSAKALDLLRRSLRVTPEDAGLLLTDIVVLSSMGRDGDAQKAVKDVQSRWPEWDSPYLLEGLLQERAANLAAAREKIQIAVALGSREPAAACALARMTSPTSTDTRCKCVAGVFEMFFPPCDAR